MKLDLQTTEVLDIPLLTEDEHELTIISVEEKSGEKQNGDPWAALNIRFKAANNEEVADIYHFQFLPPKSLKTAGDKRSHNALVNLLNAFGLDAEADTEEWTGSSGYAEIGTEEGRDGNPRNVVKRFITQ